MEINIDENGIKRLVDEFKNTTIGDLKEEIKAWRIETFDKFLVNLRKDYEKRDFKFIRESFDIREIIAKEINTPREFEDTIVIKNEEDILKKLFNSSIQILSDFKEELKDSNIKQQKQQTIINQNQITETIKKETIKSTFKDFVKYQKDEDNWSKDTQQLANRTGIILYLYFKNKDIKTISHLNMIDFKNMLFELPKNFMNMKFSWKEKFTKEEKKDEKTIYYDKFHHLDYILEYNEDIDKLSNKTIKDYIIKVNQYFTYLEKFELVNKYFPLSTPDPKKNNGREHYEDEEVIKIFDLVKKETKDNYYITLLAAYHGMRLKEITQLTKDDIIEINDITCISINTNNNKTTKNKNSIRAVPVHKNILKSGFLEYIKTKEENIFSIDNKKFSSYFRRRYKNIINENKTFYCLRHSFITKLVEKFDNIENIAMIVGHAKQYEITFGYNHKVPIKRLKTMVDSISF